MDETLKNFETIRDPDLAPTDQLLGMTVSGRYFIEKELGHGGVGAVYLARDRKLHDKPVVVKVLLEKSLRDVWVALKFQQEKEALARVDHPGVVGILDTGDLPDAKPYIVMQYILGRSLRDAIKAKPEGMDFEPMATIVRQAGAALSAVHEKKIYHRDLKPENIMLQKLARGDEQVKIVDFGIAKVKDSVLAPSTITGVSNAGTILYMSPEQLHGDRITAASDIYSFGVIAYEMVTGRRPFNPSTIAHLSEMQRQGVRVMPIDLRPRLPPEAQAIILKALAFDPAARFQNAGEFGDALTRSLMNEEEALKHPKELSGLPSTQVSGEAIPPLPKAELDKSVDTPLAPTLSTAPVTPEIQNRTWPRLAALAVLLTVALFAGGYLLITKWQTSSGAGEKGKSGNPVTSRSLVYSLTVQKMRDGKPYQQPFESSGQEIFESGYKFRLNVSSPQSGYLYVFNEGADEKTGMSFTIIYPTPEANSGSATLGANQTIQTNWNTFAGQAGTEEFWIVWSASPIPQMEAARDAAFRNEEGALTDAGMVRTVRTFLTSHADPRSETTKDTMRKQTEVRAPGEVLVKLVELEHR